MDRSAVGQPMRDEFKVYYADDADPEKAGQGLALAPRIGAVLGLPDLNYWLMSPAEQMAMVYLLDQVRPQVGIEIGTRFGGSLQVLAKYCERVHSLDIDPEVPRRLAGKHANVEYHTGPSDRTLPPLLARLSAEAAAVGFVLVDGDHSAAGVKADIDHVLSYRPVVPMYVVMHDSFNPDCRQGLIEARWADCPYVHAVELDFVQGTVNPSPAYRDSLWGGLALGVLLPEKRTGRLQVIGRGDRTFAFANRAGGVRSLAARAVRRLRRVVGRR